MCSHSKTEIKDGKIICSTCGHIIGDDVEDSCGCVFCDLGLRPMHLTMGWMHMGHGVGRNAPCTNPNRHNF